MKRVELPNYITSHPLYLGGLLELTVNYGGNMQEIKKEISQKIQILNRCDDLTPNEKSYREALQRYMREEGL